MNNYSLSKLPSDYMTIIPQRLKFHRKNAKLSQKQLANKASVSLGSLKRFEQTGEISFSSLLRLMHVLGTLDDFNLIMKYDEQLEKVKKYFDA